MPFLTGSTIVVYNGTGAPIPSSSVYIAPLNGAENFLISANFYSDNNVSADSYAVEVRPDNSFDIDLGTFAGEQSLVLEFATLLPTSYVVEFVGATESERIIVDAGNCDLAGAPNVLTLPVDFFGKYDFPEAPQGGLMGNLEDIVEPIGPANFEVVLDYDCGSGPQQQVVPMGAPVEYCGISLNMPPDV